MTVLQTNSMPIRSRYSSLSWRISLRILKFGMPYSRMPPGTGHDSNTVHECPCFVSSSATASPAGPEPMIATFRPGRRRHRRHRDAAVAALVVGDERLELADRDRRLLAVRRGPDREADDARALAERFLRAEAAAHVGQVARLAELVRGAEDVALLEQDERRRDVVAGRAGLLAGRRRAVDAALRLDDRRSRGRSRGTPRPSCGRAPPASASGRAAPVSGGVSGYRARCSAALLSW